MRNATRVTASTFGAIAGLAGIEHGVGEVLQGNVAPDGVMILSWPDSEFFAILAGEPAMTVVPNFLVSGVLSILLSLVFIVWAATFIDRRRGGLVLILLSVVLLLVGGGFGPPLLGIAVGIAATGINAPLAGWRVRLPAGLRHVLARLWPWLFGAALIAWLLLMPGLSIIDQLLGVSDPESAVPAVAFPAFGLFLLAVLAAFAYDTQRQAVVIRPA